MTHKEEEERARQEGDVPKRVCPQCKRLLYATWKRCPYCGRDFVAQGEMMPRVCPQCKRLLEAEWITCPYCRRNLAESQQSTTYDYADSPTSLWYLVPFFFGIIGGLVGYVGVKDEDQGMANNLLIFGLIWSLVLAIIGYAWFFSLLH